MSQLFEADLRPLGMEDRIEKPTADRARTERRRLMLERGEHPTGNGSIDTRQSCGNCIHCTDEYHGGGGRLYHKCDVSRLGRSHSAASDVRLSWPACGKFEARA